MHYQVAHVSTSVVLNPHFASKAETDDMRLTADIKAKIQENFKKCYTSDTAQTILNTSTWSDPHYKTKYLSEEEAKNATENIKRDI